jgi:hypothetical protein
MIVSEGIIKKNPRAAAAKRNFDPKHHRTHKTMTTETRHLHTSLYTRKRTRASKIVRFVKDKSFIDPFALVSVSRTRAKSLFLAVHPKHMCAGKKVSVERDGNIAMYIQKQKRRLHFSGRTNNFFFPLTPLKQRLNLFFCPCARCHFNTQHYKCESMLNTLFSLSLLQVISGT